MKADNRTKNASRNMLWGLLNKVVMLILPFVTRTLTLYLLGANFLGIGTLFSSILSFLSLAELGLSSAIVYAMYRPIAEGDSKTVGALLKYYQVLYRRIGCIMLFIGTIILPFIPYLINSGIPVGINIYVLYYIYLVNSVISYLFSGYRSSLLSAYQREDISTKILISVNILTQIGQIFALCMTKNFYVYAIVPIIGTIITNTAYMIITKKMYPEIVPVGIVAEETRIDIKKKISGLIGTKLNSIVVHSADTIVISSFLGLTMTAQYGNYYMIFNSVCSFIAVFFTALTASIGNKLVTDSLDENYCLFKNLSFVNLWIVCWGCSCFVCLYEPFMSIWVGDDLKLGILFGVLMGIYFYIYQIQKTILTFKDAAGLWHADKLRPYVSMVVNLVSNLVLVQVIGIYGIVLSTIIAFFISLPWANKVLFDNLFHKDHMQNLMCIVRDFFITSGISALTYGLCSFCPNGISGFIIRFLICCLIPNILLWMVYFKSEEFKYWKNYCVVFFLKLKERR